MWSWPVTASRTVRDRAMSLVGVMSPYPKVVMVTKL